MFKIYQIFLIVSLFFFSGDKIDYETNKKSTMNIYDIEINNINGKKLKLSEFKGKYMLFVNVASNCGFTNQYKSLQKLYQENSDKLVVIGVPCNQFGRQEPGSEEQISVFCSENYNVTFPMTEKTSVRGPEQHKLYKWLTQKELNGRKNSSVKWNFQKYLVDGKGELIDYWYSLTSPTSSKITNYFK